MRAFRLWLFFLVGLLLGGFCSFAFAETRAATPNGTAPKVYGFAAEVAGGWIWNPLLVDTCKQYVTKVTGYTYVSSTGNGTTTQGVCTVRYTAYGTTQEIGTYYQQSCGVAGGTPITSSCPTVYTCPTGGNWTLTGQTCTRPDCAADEVRDSSGVCTCPSGKIKSVFAPFGCVAKCNAGEDFSHLNALGDGNSVPSEVCYYGCIFTTSGVGVVKNGMWASALGVNRGIECKAGEWKDPVHPDDPPKPVEESNPMRPDAPETDCVKQGMAYGTVNGVVVCVKPDVVRDQNTTHTETNPGPGGTTPPKTVEVSNNTVCTGNGSCTTTTTTTTISGGSGPGGTGPGSHSETETTTTTSSGSLGGGLGEDGGGGGGSGSGNGVDGGDIPEEGPLESKAIGTNSITPYTVSSVETCPQPVRLPVGDAVISYDMACQLAGWIKPFVLLFAWLTAGYFVIGGKQA